MLLSRTLNRVWQLPLLIFVLVLSSFPQATAHQAGVERSEFGRRDDGTVIEAFTLRNAKGATAKIITYGATLVSLEVPDRKGKMADVVLGFDELKGYTGDHPHFGGIIGRYAN